MTHEKHLRIAENAIQKGIDQRLPAKQIAETLVSKLELALELEMDEAVPSADFTPNAVRSMDGFRPNLDTLKTGEVGTVEDYLPPPSIGDKTVGSSLITDPYVEDKPIRIQPPWRRSTSPSESTALKRYWTLSDLWAYVNANTPDDMPVMTEGRSKPIVLVRKVETMPGVDLVRLNYSIPDTADPEPSSPNSRLGGEALSPMKVNTPIFVNFSCYNKDQDLSNAMDQISKLAVAAMKPRPQHIESSTPIRPGSLTFDLKEDPHEDVGPLKDPTTGVVW